MIATALPDNVVFLDQPKRTDNLVDLFAGCGGSGGGLLDATAILDRQVSGTFVNHCDVAIRVHSANHPEHRHLEEDLFTLDPTLVFPANTYCSLLWASPQCFPADVMITTARGMLPISDVREGDIVLTHKGRWRKVTAKFNKVADTIKLKGHGHYGLETTAEHPFYSKRITTRFPGKNHHTGKRPGKKRTLVENPHWPEAKDMPGKLWAIPTCNDALPMPMDHGMVPDTAFFYVVGRWLGDGNVNKGDVVISCGYHEAEEFLRLVCSDSPLVDKDGRKLQWRVENAETAAKIILGNAGLARFLVREFVGGAATKNMPGWCLGLPSALRKALLRGYLDADGHEHPRRSSASTVSKALAVGVKILLAAEKFAVTHLFQPNDRGEIEGRKLEGQMIHGLTWAVGNRKETCLRDSLHQFQMCKKLLPGNAGVKVYNLQVDEDESYVADGIVVRTFFSVARGASCVNEQDRSHAHSVTDWARHLNPEAVIATAR